MSYNHTDYRVDAVIIGGGIAGLFTLAKLTNAGYHAVLLEQQALGGGQTIHSQGIIHGGTKYALLGKQTAAQQYIADMPRYWRACLAGKGDVNLSACTVLADKQCMWAMPNLSGLVTGFFAGKLMKSRVATLADADRPIALQHTDCRGHFYALDEPVLDTQSLVKALTEQYGRFIISDCQTTVNGKIVSARFADYCLRFEANKVLVTAGQGNSEFAVQQLRPLRMVTAHVPKAFGKLFVHILETSDKPRLTVSTYETATGWLWYLGGNIAEKGAYLSATETITLAKHELATALPWLDFSTVAFNTVLINRVEGLADGKRPNTPTIVEKAEQLIAWPTKLAMSPILADKLTAAMPTARVTVDKLPDFPTPRVASFPW